MRFLRLLPLAALVFAGACDKDAAVTNVARPPLAFIRYVNAVPDAPNNLDFKFMDDIEYSPSYANAGYRSVGIYQGARAGARPVKVFRNSSDINETQEELVSTTLNLTANTYYTILHMGYYSAANGTPAQALVVIEDTRPAQDAGLHISAVNTTNAAADVYLCTPSTLTLVSGGGQSGNASAFLADSIGVELTDSCGFPVEEEPVTFAVTSGGGGVTSGSGSTTAASNTLETDEDGLVAVRWRLGAAGAQALGISTAQVAAIPVTATINPAPFTAGFNAIRALSGDTPAPAPTMGGASVIAGGSPTLATNIAPATRTGYVTKPTGRFWVRYTAAGDLNTTALAAPIAGVAGTTTADPVGGYAQAGTQFSAFLFPASSGGAAPSITVVVDRQPPRTVPE